MIPEGIVSASTLHKRWLLVPAAWILLAVASCSGGGSASAPGSTTTSPSPTIVNPAPLVLQGAWVTALAATGEQVTLTLEEVTYRITRGADTASGSIAVRGDQIDFTRSQCGTGTYRWSLTGDSLVLTGINQDPCAGRVEVLVGETYSKRVATP